jgi:Mn2+/Fe2+ NRAMP family transporter
VTLSFVIAAVRAGPPIHALANGLVPSLPPGNRAKYLYMAVSTLGATISPYMVSFYGSGAVEEQWNQSHLRMNNRVHRREPRIVLGSPVSSRAPGCRARG